MFSFFPKKIRLKGKFAPLKRRKTSAIDDIKTSSISKWEMGNDGYYIIIQGTTFAEFVDYYEEGGIIPGVYNPLKDEYMIAAIGNIVEHTDTALDSGVLYVQVIRSDIIYSHGNFIAIGWRNKTGGGIDFATSSDSQSSLAGIKAKYGSAWDFVSDNYFEYERR